MQLQKQIKEVLDKLIEESIVREEKGSFFFFNEDEIDVQNYIKNQSLSVDDRLEIFDKFAKDPFGWRHEAVLHILVNLVKKKKREFKYRNTPRFGIVEFINKAVST